MTTITNNFYANRNIQFYLFQLAFWLGLMLITFFSLTLWYGTAELSHILHTLLQAVLGVVVSWPLRGLYTRMWERPLWYRMAMTLLAICLSSILWTAARMITFIWIVREEKNLWQDFGGWYFGGFFIFFCWTAMYYGVRYYNLMQLEHRKVVENEAEIQREHNRRLLAEAEAREAQLKMLRYQLNPHFLFNTLNAIYALIRMKDNQAAQGMVQQLSKFLRYSLDSDPSDQVSLEKELEALMLYLDIEKVRFGERLSLEVSVSDAARVAQIPNFLLQPLVENSIKHAISPSPNGGTIGIAAEVQGETLELEVWDTGPGLQIDEQQLQHGRGIGLRNTLDRLQILYGARQSVELIESDCTGLKVKLNIPYSVAQAQAQGAQAPFSSRIA